MTAATAQRRPPNRTDLHSYSRGRNRRHNRARPPPLPQRPYCDCMGQNCA